MKAIDTLIQRAVSIVGEHAVITGDPDLEPYSHDESAGDAFSQLPEAVVKPATEEETAQIIRLCSNLGIAITPRGGGTGLSAGCVPSPGGIVISLERMNKVLEVDRDNMIIAVEAGVPLKSIYDAVEGAGLFFPPHPGDEGAMAGGVVASNAGGARAVKYGTIKQFVRGLKVVTAAGDIITLGGKVAKSSSGYHLLDLMIGSEGTLGIITQVTLSLLPVPGSIKTMVLPFSSIETALEASLAVFRHGIIPFAMEYMENRALSFSERLVNKTWPGKSGEASLLILLEGTGEDEVLHLAERTAEAVESAGPLDVFLAEGKEKQAEILEIRSMIYEALRPGVGEIYDICVPRAEIPGHLAVIQDLEKRLGVPLPTIGHTGDGNVHTTSMRFLLDEEGFGAPIKDWEEKNREVEQHLYEDAIARGGVISGEHGIGLAKRSHLVDNVGVETVEVMRRIKEALDPQGIMNPGKILPGSGAR